jgi:hypothetical protein
MRRWRMRCGTGGAVFVVSAYFSLPCGWPTAADWTPSRRLAVSIPRSRPTESIHPTHTHTVTGFTMSGFIRSIAFEECTVLHFAIHRPLVAIGMEVRSPAGIRKFVQVSLEDRDFGAIVLDEEECFERDNDGRMIVLDEEECFERDNDGRIDLEWSLTERKLLLGINGCSQEEFRWRGQFHGLFD